MKKISTLLFLIILFHVTLSQEKDKSILDEYFEVLEANNKFMGSVALMKEGEIIYSNQVGFSDLENDIRPDDDTKYRIGSISKTFTATLIFQAIEEDKITLDQTIENYFPSIHNSDKITIGNLLNHRSGIFNFTNDKKQYLKYQTDNKSKKEMVKMIADLGSVFEPDSKAEYSNSNYVLLSYILEEVYNKSYAKILDEKIIEPANLKDTYFGGEIAISSNECFSYMYDRKWKKQPETNTSIPMGAGGIVSTPSDLVHFASALFTEKLISNSSLLLMKEIKDNYGMGLFQIPFYDKMSYGHNGSIDGFSAALGYFEEGKIAFAFTSNGMNYVSNDISITLLRNLFDKPLSIPSFEIFKIKSKQLDQYVGTYASESFPLKIAITKSDKNLMAQATGQTAFTLEATSKNTFKFDRAGIVIEFNLAKNQLTIKQGGVSNILTKE